MILTHVCLPRQTPRPHPCGVVGPAFLCEACGGKVSLTFAEAEAFAEAVNRINAHGGDA
jgi:hypothetical protein